MGVSSFEGMPEKKSFLFSAHISGQLVLSPIRGLVRLKSWTKVLVQLQRASHNVRDAWVPAPVHQDYTDATSRTSFAPDVKCRKKLFKLTGRTQQNQASSLTKHFESGTKQLAKGQVCLYYSGGLGLPISLTPPIWNGSWQVPGTMRKPRSGASNAAKDNLFLSTK